MVLMYYLKGEILLSINKPSFCISNKIIILLIMASCFLLYLFSKTPKKPPSSISLEGKNTYWSVSTTIPYTEESDDKYVKVTFTCPSVEHILSESDVISFAMGTPIGTSIYSYEKSDGYIKSEYSINSVERITRVSDDTFEVLFNFKDLFDKDIFYLSKKDININVQISTDDEPIDLLLTE